MQIFVVEIYALLAVLFWGLACAVWNWTIVRFKERILKIHVWEIDVMVEGRC